MASIFSRIVAGEIPCYKVAETENCLAFLDISPLAKGHVLCIPKKEVDYIFDLDDELFSELHLFSKRVAHAIAKVCPCLRVGVAVVGVDVPHAHIHLIPLNDANDIDFRKERIKLSDDEMKSLAQQINQQVML
ncbi:MAG: HIT family protein [Bacteroidales bacterium]|nr:HIT family protein [Bacteroidales bacterium]